VKYAFISQHRGEFDIAVMCRVLEVSKSGFYDWSKRDHDSKRAQEQELIEKIGKIHEGSRKTYGSPRIFKVLKGLGEKIGKGRVEKLMRENDIRAKQKRKFKATTDSKHSLSIAPNVADRNFEVGAANKLWCSDITYIWTTEGWLYLAIVIDVGTRKLVGWSMQDNMKTDLVLAALEMAYKRQNPGRGLIHHADRGSQYASHDFRQRLWAYGMIESMSGKGNCWDNAVAESFFHTLKTECVYQERFKTREQARQSIFDYIEVFYNRQRLHSALGYVSPECYERKLYLKCA